jgi:hypothetical protein
MKQVGYRPFHATKRLNNGEKDLEEDPNESLEETLRNFVREHVRGVYFLGFKTSSLDVLKQACPELFSYVKKNYPDFMHGCKVAFKQTEKFGQPVPYILLPNKKMTVISWDKARAIPTYPTSEDLARYIEKLK